MKPLSTSNYNIAITINFVLHKSACRQKQRKYWMHVTLQNKITTMG